MAVFRKIHTSFWSDTFVQDLDNDHKLFYLYILTNERTKQCGIYEISKKQISYDLGYSIDRVSKLFKFFIDNGKILYSETTKELAIKNWNKFNGSTSPKVVSCVKSELSNVKDTLLIQYVNGMYTASQEEEEEEQEEDCVSSETKPTKITFEERQQKFLDWFNNRVLFHKGKLGNFSILSKATQTNLKTILKNNYTGEQLNKAFLNMYNSKWVQETSNCTPTHFLVVDNFQRYLNQDSSSNNVVHTNIELN